jgi:hypothetical protein
MATTKLKLHREKPVTTERAEEIPATFRFPAIPRGRGEHGQAQRQTLVAGRVEPDDGAMPDKARSLRPPPLKLTAEDGTVHTPELVRQIEQTLEAMQARVDRLRKHVDEPYRFPTEQDDHDHRPTAA